MGHHLVSAGLVAAVVLVMLWRRRAGRRDYWESGKYSTVSLRRSLDRLLDGPHNPGPPMHSIFTKRSWPRAKVWRFLR